MFTKDTQTTVWFIGSNPSKKNKSPAVPFEGTRSALTLEGWITSMGIVDYKFGNVCGIVEEYQKLRATETDLAKLYLLLKREPYVVALGNFASKALEKLRIPHFKLPHPSPRNLLLNDSTFIEQELVKCEAYLQEIKCNLIKMDSSSL